MMEETLPSSYRPRSTTTSSKFIRHSSRAVAVRLKAAVTAVVEAGGCHRGAEKIKMVGVDLARSRPSFTTIIIISRTKKIIKVTIFRRRRTSPKIATTKMEELRVAILRCLVSA